MGYSRAVKNLKRSKEKVAVGSHEMHKSMSKKVMPMKKKAMMTSM